MKACNIRVYGKVQRVGYRMYVLDNAQRLKVYGYIKNEPDGSVSIFVQGEEDNINRFISLIKNAPKPIIVESIDVNESSIDASIKTFEIISKDLSEELQEGFGAMQSIFMSEFGDYRNEFRDYREEFRSFVGEFRDYREEFRSFVGEFRDYREEFRDFANRTDNNFNDLKNEMREFREESRANFNDLKNEIKLTRDEIKEFREDTKESFNELKNEMREFREESNVNLNDLKDMTKIASEYTLGSSKILRDEIKGFREDTKESFTILNNKYGEISDKLTMILEQLRKDREEANKRWEDLNKDLKKSIDALVELVRNKI